MADASDVSNALAALCASTILPNGVGQPGLISQKVLIYVGWPDKGTLDSDLAGLNQGNPAARVHVSVYPRPSETVTTKYRAMQTVLQTYSAPTITLAISGQTVTLSGSISAPQNVALLVDGETYTYAVQSNDTLTSVATALAVQITGATSSGPTITAPTPMSIEAANSGGCGTVMQFIRRQRKEWQITVWAHNDATREALAAPLDDALADIRFLALPDQTGGQLKYVSTLFDDKRAPVQLYRRDFIYSVEYDTTKAYAATDVVTTQFNNDTGVSGACASTSTVTTSQ